MAYTMDHLTKAYISIREERAKLLSEYESKDAELKDQIAQIQSEILAFFKGSGLDGLKTKYGSINRTVKERYWCTDWDELKKFIKEHDALDLFEKRIHQTSMKQFMESNPELRPPGVNVDREFVITVRKSK
jgi:hypothetical protein